MSVKQTLAAVRPHTQRPDVLLDDGSRSWLFTLNTDFTTANFQHKDDLTNVTVGSQVFTSLNIKIEGN